MVVVFAGGVGLGLELEGAGAGGVIRPAGAELAASVGGGGKVVIWDRPDSGRRD